MMPSYTSYINKLHAMDANDDNIETWITVNGNHIPIMKGQSKEEAVKNFIAKKQGGEESSGGKKQTFYKNVSGKQIYNKPGISTAKKGYTTAENELLTEKEMKKHGFDPNSSAFQKRELGKNEHRYEMGARFETATKKPNNKASESQTKKEPEDWKAFSARTGITPEDFEAYEWVRESGAFNMFDYENVSRESGLSKDLIKKIQQNYEEADKIYNYDPYESEIPDDYEIPEPTPDEKLRYYAEKRVQRQEDLANLAPSSGGYNVYYTDFLSPSELEEYEKGVEEKIQKEYERIKAASEKAKAGNQPESKPTEAAKKSDRISGDYSKMMDLRRALWDAGYEMSAKPDEDFGVTGTEYVWKDGTMYAVNIKENPDGSAEAKMSSMGEVSHREYVDYLDEDEGRKEDDDSDSDISGISSSGEAMHWLNTQIRKHGNTYFWKGELKSALNKLVEKFGNTYFWDK